MQGKEIPIDSMSGSKEAVRPKAELPVKVEKPRVEVEIPVEIKPEAPVKPTEPPVEAVKPGEVVTEPVKVEKPVEAEFKPEVTPAISKDEIRIVKQLALPDPLPKGEKLITGKDVLKYDWISKAEQAGEFDRLESLIKQSRVEKLKDKQAKFLLDVYEAQQATGNEQGQVGILFDIAKDEGIITEAEGQAVSDLIMKGKKPPKRLLGEAIEPESLDAYLEGLKKRYSETVEAPVEAPPTEVVEGARKDKTDKLNKRYNLVQQAQLAAETSLRGEGLLRQRRALYEKSFQQATEQIEALEKEAKTEGITLEKKPTETDAIIELKDLFQGVDPEVAYEDHLSEIRTVKDAIEDSSDPATAESVAQAIEEAGNGFSGVKFEDIKIAGQNYQEIRDGVLVDVIKLHKGADMGTVIHERSETWYRRQESKNPEVWDAKITKERKGFHERTGEKDDPTKSNREWFSDRSVDYQVGAKPKGAFSASLQRIFDKFKEYAKALRQSAKRLEKYIKEGKVSKELQDLLRRSVEEPIKTPKQVAKSKVGKKVVKRAKKPIKKVEGDIALEPKVPKYSLELNKKGRTHSELEEKIPESKRVARKKPKGEPMRHISGKKFKDLDNLDKTESNVSITQEQLEAIWGEVVESTEITTEEMLLIGMKPYDANFWNRAFNLPDGARYWYEISSEGFSEKFPDLTPVEMQTALAVSAASSILAKPTLQIARTIAVLSEVERGVPVMTGVPQPQSITSALYDLLEGLKTGNFEQTFSYLMGNIDKPPLTTNDRQVAEYMNVDESAFAADKRLYEAASKFHNGIRDLVNTQIEKGKNPYESYQLQALPWVQVRYDKKVSESGDNLLEALDINLKKLKDAGLDVPVNENGEMYISKEFLKDPRIVDVLSPTTKQFEQAKIATVEVGTTLTPEGKSAAKLNSNLKKLREGVTDSRKLNSIDKALDEYDSIRRRNLGKLSKPNANLGKKSIAENLIRIISNRATKVTRIEYGRGVGGTYEGVFSPNIRIPLVTKFAPKGSSALDNNQTNQLLAILGDKLEQAAMAASSFTNAEPSKSPDTHSALIEHEGIIDSRDIEAIENVLNRESGLQFSFNIKKVPNGTVVDVNPHFNEDFTMTAPDKHILSSALKTVLGDKVDINLFDNTYISNYIEQPEYANYIKDLKNEISRRQIEKLQSQIGGTKKRISQAVKGRKEVGDILEGFSKSDIERAEKARIRYRNDRNRFRETTQEIDRIASSVKREDAQWDKTHSSKLPTYELKKLSPKDRRLREEREKSEAEQALKTAKETFETLRDVDEKTSELPKYARSINLEKQAIDDALKILEVNLGKIEAKKVQTWDETGKIRDEILGDYKKTIKLLQKAKRQGIVNAAEMAALRQINVNAIHRMKEMVENDVEKDLINEYEKYYEDIFKLTSDVSSEIGRALNIHKQNISENRVAKAFTELKRGLNERELAEFKKLNFENPMEVKRFIDRLGDPTLMNYVYEYWYNAILSGIPTHAVNIASNTAWGLFQIPMRGLAGGIDKLITTFTGKQRQRYVNEMIPMFAGYRTGVTKGGRRFWKTMKTGEPPMDIDDKWAIEMGKNISAFQRSPYKVLRQLATPITVPTRSLRGMDVWANSIAFDAQIAALARRSAQNKGLKGQEKTDYEEELKSHPTNAMIEDAKTFAKHSTFMDDPGKFTAGIIKLRDKAPGSRFIVPFVNTISNLLKRGIEMTPGVGLVRGKEYYKGQAAADIIAKQIVGAVIALYLIYKVDDDEIVGKAPKNKNEREAFYRQKKKAWSIKVGDTWVQYRRIEPFNTVIASVVIAREALKKEKDEDKAAEIFFRASEGVAENLLDASYLQGVSSVLDKHQNREGMFQRLGASFVPYSGFWRSINRSVEVLTEGEAKYRPAKTFFDAITQVIPGLSKDSPAKINVWGEEVVLEGGVFRQWIPYKWSEETKDPLELELQRVGIYPGLPGKRVTIRGKEVEFPADFYRDYCIFYGKKAKIALEGNLRPHLKPDRAYEHYDNILNKERTKALKKAKHEYRKTYGSPR